MNYNKFEIKDLRKLEKVKLIWAKEKIYFGQVEKKRKHGKGIIFYNSGKVFEGSFL